MTRPPFFSFSRQPLRKSKPIKQDVLQHRGLSLIATPIDERDGESPHFCRHSDATPIELFFDLFFVANLSSFTATHEINNVEGLGAYIGFLGVIWFTWLQITLFDIRFARDSVFERICKAAQLAAMVGFASAGTRFTTQIRGENVWAFQSLSLLLGGSRVLLAVQYAVNICLIHERMRPAARGLSIIVAALLASSLVYFGMYFAFQEDHGIHSYIWTVWFMLFCFEMWMVMGVSFITPDIGFEDTHLAVRMGLLTLIIIGEGVIAVTRIANKTVRPGGWTKWSFVHILGVTTNVYFLWQAYFDVSPRVPLGKISQQAWAQLHFPFHVALILLLEGSQILALTLDVTLKLTYLTETIQFACEEPRPEAEVAIRLLRSTIADMEIDYGRGAMKEKAIISDILEELLTLPLCPTNVTSNGYFLTHDRMDDLVGNVTAALFSSMGITPSEGRDISQLNNSQLLMMYVEVLGFVYVYFFVVASVAMFLFAAFTLLAHRHQRKLYVGIGVAVRLVLAALVLGMVSFVQHFALAYSFMTSPAILYAFTVILLTILLVDRLLDHFEGRSQAKDRSTRESDAQLMPSGPRVVALESSSYRVAIRCPVNPNNAHSPPVKLPMHVLHPPSTTAIDDRSGELGNRKGNMASLKAMLRMLVSPDHSKTCLIFKKNPDSIDTEPASYLSGNREYLSQTKLCDQQSELCARKMINYDQAWTNHCTGVTEGLSEATVDTSNKLPMADEQTMEPNVCSWSDMLTSFESGHGLAPEYCTCPANIQTLHRPTQPEKGITGPENSEQHDELKLDVAIQDSDFRDEVAKSDNYHCGLMHSIPRPSLYMAADPFGSSSETNATSHTIPPSVSRESLPDSFKGGLRKVHRPYGHIEGAMIFHDQSSPGSSVATTNYPYNPMANTCSGSTPIHWSRDGQMVPWEMQTLGFELQNNCFSQLRHHGGRVAEIPRNPTLDACHGLPSVDCSQHYSQQPPSVLYPFTPHEYNSTSANDRSAVDDGHCQLTYTNANLTYPQHRHEIMQSVHLESASDGALTHQGRKSTRSISCHNEVRNAFLIECKRRGLSYKDIKRLGGFEEAESTLRGRFRTLTKSKEQRVRKPQWKDKDIELLCKAVNACSGPGKQTSNAFAPSCRPRGVGLPPRVSWKKVAQYIWTRGGSYHFGNATCKKKWCEVHNVKI
ncbi:hypothetical protein KXW42_002312 [Aspergillus fumigatus]|uniref:Uncharacterized protein n=1 Tax=Aspergillus fumigatus TaxID=746128 RepID=A0A9P8SUZ2_ASPFM|nr:hypothetical protein KXX50_008220 [Aspergillus fumigatus]KAH1559144.1 hypothetical protein KXX37_005652 [Aspergillus fumigatus]KAH1908065.1 hypothetical protein KXV57_003833 [Aspergillus fumigatus]KAH2125001.1 hypothetical protein KXW75_006499 [Aspergillus fumigatus]KAH2238985.1 hypothetical protein KXW71_003098 [Aspergillus fumigatus]